MKPILVYQTDFTYKEGAVCAMYGVVKSVDRELEIIDGTHEIPQYDIWSASFRLHQSMKFWPEGTIFVSVVDPGVGTSRRSCVARTLNGYTVVTPDNGTLTHTAHWTGISEVRQIDETVNRLRGQGTEGTNVFHGRDVFSYCAARLASGIITYEQVGPVYPVDQVVRLPLIEPHQDGRKIRGIFEIGDPNFGNLWTNIPCTLFTAAGVRFGDRVSVTIHHRGNLLFQEVLPFERTFGLVNLGEMVVYNNEMNHVSIAVNQGSFSGLYGFNYGPDWEVAFERVD